MATHHVSVTTYTHRPTRAQSTLPPLPTKKRQRSHSVIIPLALCVAIPYLRRMPLKGRMEGWQFFLVLLAVAFVGGAWSWGFGWRKGEGMEIKDGKEGESEDERKPLLEEEEEIVKPSGKAPGGDQDEAERCSNLNPSLCPSSEADIIAPTPLSKSMTDANPEEHLQKGNIASVIRNVSTINEDNIVEKPRAGNEFALEGPTISMGRKLEQVPPALDRTESFSDDFWKSVGLETTQPTEDRVQAIEEEIETDAEVVKPPEERVLVYDDQSDQASSVEQKSDEDMGDDTTDQTVPTTPSRSSYRPLPPLPPDTPLSHENAPKVERDPNGDRRPSRGHRKELPSPPTGPTPTASHTDLTSDTTPPLLPTFLDLHNQNLPALPPLSQAHCRALSRLIVNHNRLTHLPDTALELMSGLRVLDVSDNALGCIPPGLRFCKELREVYLSGNGIERIGPGDLDGCVGVEVLGLARNGLFEIAPNAFKNHVNLRFLDVSFNRLRTFPASLGLLSSTLQKLVLDDNPIETSLFPLIQPLLTINPSSQPRPPLRARQSSGNFKALLSSMGRKREGSVGSFEESVEEEEGDGRSMTSFDSGVADLRGSLVRSRTGIDEDFRTPEIVPRSSVSESNVLAAGGRSSSSGSRIALRRVLNHLRDVWDISLAEQASRKLFATTVASPVTEVERCLVPDDYEEEDEEDNDSTRTPGSESPPSDSPPVQKKVYSPERRQQIANEIVSTERTYVKELQGLVDVYVGPLREEGVFGERELGVVFGNVEKLLEFHKSHLLPDVIAKAADSTQPLGSAFLSMSPYLKAYQSYYNNYDSANAFITHLDALSSSSSSITLTQAPTPAPPKPPATSEKPKHVSKRYKLFCQKAKTIPAHGPHLNLQSWLILPVQRLPRYKLLIDALLNATPPTHPDFAACQEAASLLSKMVRECNESKREFEALEGGLGVLSRLRVKKFSVGNLEVSCKDAKMMWGGTLRVLKYVCKPTDSLDFMTAVGKRKVFPERIGSLMEMRVNKRRKKPKQDSDRILTLLAEHGLVSTTHGQDFSFHVIGSRFFWCRAHKDDTDLDLVKSIDVDRVWCGMVFTEGGVGCVRVWDEGGVVYLVGKDVKAFVKALEGAGAGVGGR
ncbi:hypothetical protein SpCBS45565_g03986 [Spizellomyces sp. 'palustris']|nr:hypothetical protein SpCBS45565_g03986 [Spizellomyces sp. 'palustris']